MSVLKDKLGETRAQTLRRLSSRARPRARACGLEGSNFVQERGRVPVAVLINHLSVAPITTDTGLSLPWTSEVARAFACDCVEHVLDQLGALIDDDLRVRDCLDTARRFAAGDADGDALDQARAGALEAARSVSPITAHVADAAASAAHPAPHDGWPAEVLWACRRAIGEAAVDPLSPGRAERADVLVEPALARVARADFESDQARQRAETREHDWQCRHLMVALEAARRPAVNED